MNNCEAGRSPAVLRFWESPVYFIVLGYANKVAEEVALDACRAAQIPIVRRCSGGGCVLQGPGCLNYAIVLPLRAVPGSGESGELATITETNRFVMERHRAACQTLASGQVAVAGKTGEVAVAGHTDLALDGRKFSGNAQRRRREWFLFHGTILYNFDLPQIGAFIRHPPRQPDYRQDRSHSEFVVHLPASRSQIENALAQAWQATEPREPSAVADWQAASEALCHERYDREDWNLKF